MKVVRAKKLFLSVRAAYIISLIPIITNSYTIISLLEYLVPPGGLCRGPNRAPL